MKIQKKYIYIIVAVFLSALFVCVSIVYHNMQNEKYAPHYPNGKAPVSEQISTEEIRAFLRTWILYCEEYGHCLQIPELSYDTTDSSNQLDPKISAWLKRQGWDVNRFVYIDMRLRVIIATILRDKEILKKQRLMQDGANNTEDSSVEKTLRRAAAFQRKKLNIEKITDTERQLVEPQLEALIKVLQGQYN